MNARTKLGWLFVLSGLGVAGAITGCPASVPDACVDDPACVAAQGDSGVVEGGPACDPSKDPSCVSDSSGIFVNGSSGADSNAGTKEAPVKTIGAAIAKTSSSKSSVYICAGTYAEHVKVTTGLSLYGGFACADWTYAATNKPKVAPSDTGYALDIENVNSAITVADLEFDSIDAVKPGDSSIAVFVASSSNVALHRVTATAGDGVAGADAAAVDVDAGTPPTPAAAMNESGAPGCTQSCGAIMSVGGKGGDGATTIGGVTNGADGGPSIPPDSFGNNGHGGEYSGGCGSGGTGATGESPDGGVAGAAKSGTLSPSGWTSQPGSPGGNGGVGQGGGGGSGGLSPAVGGGGGGGCGGCGGAGGAAGNSGGSSFALLIFQSSVTVDTCTLTAGKGGDGKAGGAGQAGQPGGNGGDRAPAGNGCTGGAGGNGGAGAGGGGGAGGDAIAIGYVGAKPSVTSTTYAEGTAGGAGAGGTGGAGNNGLSGATGIKADIQELP